MIEYFKNHLASLALLFVIIGITIVVAKLVLPTPISLSIIAISDLVAGLVVGRLYQFEHNLREIHRFFDQQLNFRIDKELADIDSKVSVVDRPNKKDIYKKL